MSAAPSSLVDPMLLACISVVPPLLLCLCACLPVSKVRGDAVARRGGTFCLLGLCVTVVLLVLVFLGDAVSYSFFPGATVYLDRLSVIILTMVAFLGLIVTHYTINHLGGDAGQALFVRQLLVTVASVECLTVSGSLVAFALTWAATSLTLHQLLIFFPERSGAQLAAKKRFLFSRLGDLCLVVALVAVWQRFGTWQFSELFQMVEQGTAVPEVVPPLFALTALLKSAQMPFHSWLPETMESPTPVSALMHAGIVNAGGFLVLRLSPLMAGSAFAMDLLIFLGGVTAVTASLVMITQTSIKRALAWSTISQMGFMMLQCGLGAFGLAALHIVAHSLYKAHAFLSVGGVVSRAGKREVAAAPQMGQWVMALCSGGLLVVLALWATGLYTHLDSGTLVLFSVLILAVSQVIATSQVSVLPRARFAYGVGLGSVIVGIVFALHFLVEVVFHPVFHGLEVEHTFFGYIMMVLVPVMLGIIIFLQSGLAGRTQSPLLRRLYIHAYHGFYLGTWLARLLGVKGSSRPL